MQQTLTYFLSNSKYVFIAISLLFTWNAHAQNIFVKYRGNINVDNGHFIELPLKSSSVVKEIWYDQCNEYLLVRLQQTFYQYCSFPVDVVNQWINAPSLGKYYTAKVKGRFDCRDYPVPEY